MESKDSNVKKILLAVLVFVLAYAGLALLLKTIGLTNIHGYVKQAGPLGPLVFILLCILGMVVAPISGSSFFALGGIVFGREVAFFLSFIASVIGCSINFWISRKLGRKVVGRFIGKSNLRALDRFIGGISSHHSIFYLILLMLVAQDLVSYAVGLTKVVFQHFMFALLVSSVLAAGTYVYLGTSLLEWLI